MLDKAGTLADAEDESHRAATIGIMRLSIKRDRIRTKKHGDLYLYPIERESWFSLM